jgi:hypothetical protein
MVAVVSTKRAASTGLTALAGLILLAAAAVMMACAAPRVHAAGTGAAGAGPVPRSQLTSWVLTPGARSAGPVARTASAARP